MGLGCCAVEMMIQEHLYRPLGDILLIGRQNTDFTAAAMTRLLSLYGLSPREPYQLERPGSLAHEVQSRPKDDTPITDVSVFRALGDYNVQALDISDYEGAEIIHDMSLPLPEHLKGRFDFVYDGSCMDNIFDGPQALINMSELLRPGGRLLAYNASNSAPTAYLQYSPDWFIDFFAVNRYVDCKAYVLELPRAAQPVRPEPLAPDVAPQPGCLWHYDPYTKLADGSVGYLNSQIDDTVERYIYILGEKGPNSTSDLAPVQMHYRGHDTAAYFDAIARFHGSSRPIFVPRSGEAFSGPSLSSVGSLRPLVRWNRRAYDPYPAESETFANVRRERDEARQHWRRLEHEKNERIRERDEAQDHWRRLEHENNERERNEERGKAEAGVPMQLAPGTALLRELASRAARRVRRRFA